MFRDISVLNQLIQTRDNHTQIILERLTNTKNTLYLCSVALFRVNLYVEETKGSFAVWLDCNYSVTF